MRSNLLLLAFFAERKGHACAAISRLYGVLIAHTQIAATRTVIIRLSPTSFAALIPTRVMLSWDTTGKASPSSLLRGCSNLSSLCIPISCPFLEAASGFFAWTVPP